MAPLFSPDQIEFLKRNYPIFGAAVCAEKLGFKHQQIRSMAQRLKLTVGRKGRSEIVRKDHINKVYSSSRVDESQFINVKTPEAAYILGLIWADGHLRKDLATIMVEIQELDGIIFLETFKKTGLWATYLRKPRKEKRKPQLSIYLRNKSLGNYLAYNDYRSKDKTACAILSKIPEDLRNYWFRGLFDGDGHISCKGTPSRHELSIASCYTQDWSYMENICKKLGIKFSIERRVLSNTKSKKVSKGSTFRIRSKYSIYLFCEYIYKGIELDEIGLPRKYNIYLKVKEKVLNPPNRCKYLCIHFAKDRGWRVRVPKSIDKANKYLGSFETEEAAFKYQQEYIKNNYT